MPNESPAEHYTAVIEVTKTTEPHQPTNRNGYAEGKPTERKVDQITHLVIRADTLPSLRERIAKHVELIDN